jgi:hypothetical protein
MTHSRFLWGFMFKHMPAMLHAIVLLLAAVVALPALAQHPPIEIPRPPVGSARLPVDPVTQDCGLRLVNAPQEAGRTAAITGISQLPPCAPPYETPPYTKPADDGVALGSLLEASGFPGAQGASWVGVAAGNFCGTAQKQLVVTSSLTSEFSLLEGPAPFLVGEVNEYPEAGSESAASWRGIAAGKFSSDAPTDAIVAVRRIMSGGEPDLVVMSISITASSPTGCGTTAKVVATGTISPDGNSDWLGVVMGNFDGVGEKIAMLRAAAPNLFLVQLNERTFNVVQSVNLDGNGAVSLWKAIAAGDIDGDGLDELIVARQESDNQSPTVVAYKWDAPSSTFKVFAVSEVGNDGNSNWASATTGDFNGDGRKAIVLVRNQSPDFVLLDWHPVLPGQLVAVDPNLPPAAPLLRTLSTANLESVSGQNWTGLTTSDWIGGDQGAAELIAVRAASTPYRSNVFVYGNPILRVPRDTGMAAVKSQYVQHLTYPWPYLYAPTVTDLKSWLRATHTNTFNYLLDVRQSGPNLGNTFDDYSYLISFLQQTRNWGVDGKLLRVWITVAPPNAAMIDKNGNYYSCAVPTKQGQPLYDPTPFFALDGGNILTECRDLLAWASAIGQLARQFPQIVGFGIDDFSNNLDPTSGFDCTDEFQTRKQFNESCIAQIESRLRAQAPWLNFVPTVYHSYFQDRSTSEKNWADLAPTLDSFLYYFRNEKLGECIDKTAECENTVNNAPMEIRDMNSLLPAGRKLQLGIYFVMCDACSEHSEAYFTPPAIRYDYDLAHLGVNMSEVGGLTAYALQTPNWTCTGTGTNTGCIPCSDAPGATACVMPNCNDLNYLNSDFPGDTQFIPTFTQGTDRFCTVWKAFGELREIVQDSDVSQRICDSLAHCPPAAAGGPFGYMYVEPGAVLTNHPLEARTVVGGTGLTTNMQNAIVRTTDGHVHRFAWATGILRDDDLSGGAGAPNAVGSPTAYTFPAQKLQNVLYRGTDNDVHRLFWSNEPPVMHEDLTAHAHNFDANNVAPAASNPIGYSMAFRNVQNVVFAGTDGVLHGFWFTGQDPVHNDLLNKLANSPSPVGDASAYLSNATSTSGLQNVLYTGPEGHLHRLTWTTGAVTAEDLNQRTGTIGPVGPAAAYFDGSSPTPEHHAFFRTEDHARRYNQNGGTVYELWGPSDPVNADELSGPLVNGPQANSNVSAYFVDSDGTNHVFYNYQGYIHELRWAEGSVVVNHENLTAFSGAPLATSDPSAYYDATNKMHHVIYLTVDGHVHEIQRND